MARLSLLNETLFGTPPASNSYVFVDQTTKKLAAADDSGIVRGILSHNQMIAASGVSTSVDTYVTNSGLLIPSFGLQVGMIFDWRVSMSKTAAGTTAAIVTFRIGANQSTADTSIGALTQTVAQTAVADSGIFRASAYVTVLSASGIMSLAFSPPGLTAFGGGKDSQSATIDLTGRAGQFIGISINANTAGVWTWTGVHARLYQ